MTNVKYKGKAVLLGDKEFIIPSLSINKAREFWPNIMDLNKGLTVAQFPERLETVLNIIHAAVVRNYPDMTIEELGDMIDASNAGDIMVAVVEASGFLRTKVKDGSSLGEVDPGEATLH